MLALDSGGVKNTFCKFSKHKKKSFYPVSHLCGSIYAIATIWKDEIN